MSDYRSLSRATLSGLLTVSAVTIGWLFASTALRTEAAPEAAPAEYKILAASTTRPPQGASYGAPAARHIPWDAYPVGEQAMLAGSQQRLSSWPMVRNVPAGRGCSASDTADVPNGMGGSFQYGEFLTLPFPAEAGGSKGRSFGGLSNCTSRVPGPAGDFSAAPLPSWFRRDGLSAMGGGAYIHPRAYGEWAAKPDGAQGFGAPAERAGDGDGSQTPACGGRGAEFGSPLIKDAAFRAGGFDGTNQSKPLWGTACKDARRLKELLSQRQGTRVADGGAAYLKSSGSTLFRQKFQLKPEELAALWQLEGKNDAASGVRLRLAVDDFAAVYVNGRHIYANAEPLEQPVMVIIPLSALQEGDNILAIEAQDRLTTRPLAEATVGARWLLAAYAPHGWKPESGEPRLFGSWGEYGLIASGRIQSASGAQLSSGPGGRPVMAPREYNPLTFANTTTPMGQFGELASTRTVDGFFQPTGSLARAVAIGDIGSGVYTAGNLELRAGTVAPGRQIIIRSSGTVTISGDIVYADEEYQRLADLPQVIISARHIVITEAVKRLDGWLVATSGSISTCDAVTKPEAWLQGLSAARCKERLRVTGPVMAQRLFLRRTYNMSGNTPEDHPGVPAEIINLRPDAYLFGQQRASGSGSIRTMYVRELPPRF